MTYLVLARKWRPRSFDTLVGQDHVVRALTHALSTQRLHHAWLFTGTRGVGKTTLSRILAKSLNCHVGITATPCGECPACTEIDAGRFVDYIELDAASNRGVDEMTQLLEQAVYSPSSGRFKVYMIDEVHMLSGHAFNAMLKTLEEPPPHVKFILATTDPQKIPATVLSRCLQFNLKQMTSEAIISYLEMVLQQEQIQFDTPALRLLAQAASGSMRDALSLTDQAIAYSAGNLTLDAMQSMLGTINQDHLTRLLRALGCGDAVGVVGVADDLAMRGLSYSAALADVAVLLSRIAIEQRIPGSASNEDPLSEDIRALAASLHPDAVQLFYSVAVHSRQELSLAPDEYAGFVMACLRMLSLLPPDAITPPVPPSSDGQRQADSAATAINDTVPEAQQADAPTMPSAGDDVVARQGRPSPSGSPMQGAALEQIEQPLQAMQTEPPHQTAPSDHAEPPMQGAPLEQVEQPLQTKPQAAQPNPAEPPKQAPQSNQAEQPTQPAQPKQATQPAQPKAAPFAQAPVPQRQELQASEAAHGPDQQLSSADVPPWEDIPYSDDSYDFAGNGSDDQDEFETLAVDAEGVEVPVVEPDAGATLARIAPQQKKTRSPQLKRMTAKDWPKLVQQLPLTGVAAQLARQSEWLGLDGDCIRLRMAIPTLAETSARARFRTVLSEHFGAVIELDIEYGETGDGTVHAIERAHLEKLQKQAEQDARNDPFVNVLISEFGGRLVSGSIQAVVA